MHTMTRNIDELLRKRLTKHLSRLQIDEGENGSDNYGNCEDLTDCGEFQRVKRILAEI